MNLYSNRYMGFNLVELLLVLVVISLLTVLTYPSYQNYQHKIQRLDAQNALLSLMQAQRLFYSQHQTFTAELDDVLAVTALNISTDWYQFTAQACEDEIIQLCVELSAIPNDSKRLMMSYNSRNQRTNW